MKTQIWVRRFLDSIRCPALLCSQFLVLAAADGAVVRWTGAAGDGSWHNALNWDLGAIPGPADDVVIDAAISVTHGSGVTPIRSLELSRQLTLAGGSLVVSNSFAVNDTVFVLNGGTLGFSGIAAFNNSSILLQDGSIAGSFRVAGGNVDFGTNSTAAGTIALRGASTVTGGIPPGMVVRVEGSVSHGQGHLVLPVPLTNQGTIILETVTNDGFDRGSYLTVSTGTLVNAAGGLIRANAGEGDGRRITGHVENLGTILVESAVSLSIEGLDHQFTQRGGLIQADGEFISQGGRFNFAGGALTGIVRARNAYVAVAENAASSSILRVVGPSGHFGGNLASDVTVWLEGSTSYGIARLTVTNAVTNDGRILFRNVTNDGFDRGCYLAIAEGGLLDNAPTGVLEFQTGAGDARVITGHLRNRGRILVESGETADFTGTLEAAGGTFEGQFYVASSELRATVQPFEPTTLLLVGSLNQLFTDNPPDLTLWLRGSTEHGRSELTLPAGVTNRGSLRLECVSNDPFDRGSRLSIATGTLVNTSTGVIQVNAGQGDPRVMDGHFENHGTILIENSITLTLGGPGHLFAQRAGLVQADGELLSDGGAFEFSGGALTGEVRARNAYILVTAGVTEPSTLRVVGPNSVLGGNLSPVVTLWQEGSVIHGRSALSITNEVFNEGRILMETISDDPFERGCFIEVATGGRLEIGPDGVIECRAGAGDSRQITGSVRNRGLITIATDETAEFRGALEMAGGACTGNLYLLGTDLSISAPPSLPTTLLLVTSSNRLLTDIAEGLTLWLQGGVAYGRSLLTLPQGATNRGTILMESVSDDAFDRGAQLVISSGTLVNAPNGTIRVNAGTGDTRRISGAFTNQGLFAVQDIEATFGAGPFINETTGVITGAGTINVTGNSFENRGTVSPGGSAGLLSFNGNYTQGASGQLVIEIGGTSAGSEHDRLAISGGATLDGVLNVSLLNNYVPAVSNTFRALTFGSISGQFAQHNGLIIFTNLALEAAYGPSALDLVTVSATNTIVTPPVIVTQPASQTIVNGQTASFRVTATGTRPFDYRWLFNDTTVVGTDSTLTLVNAQTNHSGSYQVVITNSAGSVASSVATLNVRPVADLVVTDIAHPTDVSAGQPITLNWRSTNLGNQPALPPWTESVSLSTNETGAPAIPIANLLFNETLSPGQSVVRTQSVITPGGLDDLYYLVIRTDTTDQVAEEHNESNNTTVAPGRIRVRSANLQALNVTLPSASALFGETIFVSWTVTNSGSAPVSSPWNDRLYLGTNRQSTAGAIELGTLPVTNVPLAQGGVLTNQLQVTLPLATGLAPGAYFVLAAADQGNLIPEPIETDNLASAPLTLALPPLPDLVVANLVAPASASSGQPVTLSWSLANDGSLPLAGTWSETVFLATNELGDGLFELGTLVFTNTLAPGGFTTRTQSVVVPISSPLGAVWFAVQADSREDVVEESEANNLVVAINQSVIPAVLTLHLPGSQITEGASQPLLASITRNGDRSQSLAISLFNSDPSEIEVPGSVTIPAGQASASFPVIGLTDGIVDGAQISELVASAIGFNPAAEFITVVDVDRPRISLSFTEQTLTEGFALTGIVTRDAATNAPAAITLSSSSPTQLLPSSDVIIPEGEFSTTFMVVALNDSLIESPQTHTITVAAPGYIGDSIGVTLIDDDMPFVSVHPQLDEISENGGPQAVLVTLTRDPVSPRDLLLDLESSNPGALLVPSRVSIPAGEVSLTFAAAAVDNETVDGPREVELRGWIMAAGGGIRLAEITPASVTITDDDGPALSIAIDRDLVAEGLDPAASATVTRNRGDDNSLVVNLISSDTTEANVPPTVTIPAGQFSAEFELSTPDDNSTDGSHAVTITASAAGYVSGQSQITVSDVLLPDLVVTSVTAPTAAETEAFVNLGYFLRNQGLSQMASNSVTQRLLLSTDPLIGDDIPVGQFPYSGSLPPGDQIGQTFQVRLPQAAGDYWLVVETDIDNVEPEILEDNNRAISTAPIRVSAEYAAEVFTTVESAPSNSAIPLEGRAFRSATGGPAPFVLVNIHIRLRGTHRIISALTDAAGNFSTSWRPLPGEAGFYEIAAAHPGDTNPPTQDTFTIYGMKAVPAAPELAIHAGASIGGVIEVINSGDLTLTDLTADVVSQPANLSVIVNLQSDVLAGVETNLLSYSITALDASVPVGEVLLRVASAEGAILEIPVEVTVEPLQPQLVALPSELIAGMKRGAQTLVQFQLANLGGTNTGPISVSLPPAPWLHLVSPNPLPNLGPGQTNVVVLQLMPDEATALTLFTGSLLLDAGGTVLNVPFGFRALSEATGDLKITTVDEFTYFAEGSPPLTNASVVIRDAVTKALITTGVTDARGEFFAPQLIEGYYELEVTAEQHTDYRATHLLVSGQTTEITTFLSRQTVRYTWTVEPTEIEDRYLISIETEFEANVPAPVVTVDPPVIDVGDMITVGQVKQLNLNIRNHGLIAVDDTRIGFSTHPFYEIVPLIEEIGHLAARSSLTIPVTIRRIGDFDTLSNGPEGVTAAAGSGCGISGSLSFKFECGPSTVGGGAPIGVSGAQNTGGCGGGGAMGSGGGGGGYAGMGFAVKITCNSRCLALAALGCVPGPVGCFFGGWACGEALNAGVNPLAILDCLIGAAGCMVPGAGIPSCYYSVARCFVGPAGPGGPVSAASSEDILDAMSPGVRAMLDAFNELTGAPDGVWSNPQANADTGDWFARFQLAVAPGSDGDRTLTPAERAELLSGTQPPGVQPSEINRFLDRWNRTLENYALGITRPEDAPSGANLDFIDAEALRLAVVLAYEYQVQAESLGFTDPVNAIVETVRFLDAQGGSGGVCATVRLRIDQDAVLSREAFRATLEFENNDAADLLNLTAQLRVTDSLGNDVTHLFGIQPPELTNLSDLEGGGSVPTGSSATAKWTIVPTVDAAPLEPVEYFVSGNFSYSLTGVVLTIPLTPVGITVHPTPLLTVRYFHERNVYSDDPHTDAVEPSIPFNLGVMVENRGAGAANNFRITSAQPEIVENEKGLLVDFKIIATEVAGQNLNPSLTATFGTIAPYDTAVARWLMTSTLQGLFIDYSATFEHIDGLGNPKLSLIDSVEIHELIHLVHAGGDFEDDKPDFLVNDLPDLRDFPDTLWMSDGRAHPVQAVTNAVVQGTVSTGNLEVELAAALPGGWTYLRVPDPANGQFALAAVTRSDGTPITLGANAWITDRTFYGLGKRPVRENVLHLLDYNSTGSYVLVYEPNPAADLDPPSSSVATLPVDSKANIPVAWSGQDNSGGQGIAFYDVYVSEDEGSFQRWLWGTLDTQAIFQANLGRNYAFYSVAVDRAGNRESPPAAPDARTSVTLTNHPPQLDTLEDITIQEGETLTLIVSASDPDTDELTFSLMPGSPSGMVLNPYSGLLSWVTGEPHGPSANPITVQVLDNGAPRLGVFGTFTVFVADENSAPELPPINNRTIGEGQMLMITNVAVDFDVPAQTLTYRLEPGAPAGATIDPATGLFAWQPTNTQGGTTNLIAVTVTDDGSPAGSTSRTFSVVVRDTRPDLTLNYGSTHLLSGDTGVLPLILHSGLEVTNLDLVFTISGERLTNVALRNLAPVVASLDFQSLGSNRFHAQFRGGSGAALEGDLNLADLTFATISNEHSAIVPVRTESISGARAGSTLPVEGRTDLGRVFIIGLEPILDVRATTNRELAAVLYAIPGQRYALEATSDLFASDLSFIAWVDATDLRTELPLRPIDQSAQFFRAVLAGPTAGLAMRISNGQVLLEWPEECQGCVLRESSSLDLNAFWSDSPVQPQLVDGRYRVDIAPGSSARLYRLDPP